jgi:hypothetical protein
MADLIMKVGENNVLVTPVKTVETTAKELVEIYDNEKSVSYGAIKIAEDEKIADDGIAYWSKKENVDAMAATNLKKYTDLKTRVTAVKAEMAKVLEEPK